MKYELPAEEGTQAPLLGLGDIGPDHLEILHVPFRSWRQFERKVTVGAQALRLTPDLPPTTGSHWRRLDEQRSDRRAFRGAMPSLATSVWGRLRAGAAGELVRDERLVDALAG